MRLLGLQSVFGFSVTDTALVTIIERLWKFLEICKQISKMPSWGWGLLLFASVAALGWYSFYQVYRMYITSARNNSELISALEARLEEYEGCRTGSPYGDRPLRVTFSDNRVAYVNFFHFMMPTPDLPGPEAMETLGPAVFEALASDLISIILTELESVTVEYARNNREKLENIIHEMVSPTFDQFAFSLIQFNLLEFCEVSP